MKTRNTIITLIVAILILILTAKYAGQSKDSEIVTENNTEENESGMSLREISNLEGQHVCSLTDSFESNSMLGTIYVKDGNLKGTYVASIAELETEITTTIIIKDNSLYTWNSIAPEGAIIALSENEVSDPNDPAFGYDIKLDYECNESDVNDSEFELPTDIQFKQYVAPQISAPTSATVPVEPVESI